MPTNKPDASAGRSEPRCTVDPAVSEYIDNHRDEINDGIRSALAEIDDLGGA